MVNWKAILQESPIDYLLEEDTPSVRYFTLRDILGKEERDSEVTAAKHAIADSPIVRRYFKSKCQMAIGITQQTPIFRSISLLTGR